MSRDTAARSTAIAPLVYWLLVIAGLLAAHRVLEQGDGLRAGAVWVGAVLGTGLGQTGARLRLRLWALTVLLPLVVMCATGIVLSMPVLYLSALDLGVMAFVPAAHCGYASMTERGGLVAFWFPTSLWMLAILDGTDTPARVSQALGGAESWVLLSALAALFVGFLFAREARRVTLWQTHATLPLAALKPATVLRRAPMRALGQAAWIAITASATLVLTAWVAPHLWQSDKAAPHMGPGGNAGGGPASGGGGPQCCPDPHEQHIVETQRLREYFPLLRADDEMTHPSAYGSTCVACIGGVPLGPDPIQVAPLTSGDGYASTTSWDPTSTIGGGSGGSWVPGPMPVTTTPPAPLNLPALQPTLKPHVKPAAPAAAPLPPAPSVPHAEPPAPAPRMPSAVVAVSTTPAPAPLPRTAAIEAHPVQWLLALVVSGLFVQLATRPLRRAVTLRHLRASLWPEPVDQKVSNLWQLVLVGLRDAGWHAAPGEQPLSLAHRANVPGVETCAQVLDRARHGVRLDAVDLDAMLEAARTAYRASRRRVGVLTRALSWLRWPLV